MEGIEKIEYEDIKGVGPVMIQSVITWLDENEDWVYNLPLQLSEEITTDDIAEAPARKICITGKMDMTRSQLASHLEQYNFKVTSTVTKDCYALIAGDSGSSKHTKAKTLGVTIIDYWSSKKDVLNGNF